MPRFQLVKRAGLDHVVVGSEIKDADALLLLATAREDDDRHTAVSP